MKCLLADSLCPLSTLCANTKSSSAIAEIIEPDMMPVDVDLLKSVSSSRLLMYVLFVLILPIFSSNNCTNLLTRIWFCFLHSNLSASRVSVSLI